MRLSVFQRLSLGVLFALNVCKVNTAELKVKVDTRVEIQNQLNTSLESLDV